MAFKKHALSLYNSVPIATNRSLNFMNYGTNDTEAEVDTDGYFNDARDKLQVGDAIDCVCNFDDTASRIGLLVTAAPSTGDVTTSINTAAASA